jgi:hypothetical protein
MVSVTAVVVLVDICPLAPATEAAMMMPGT